MAAFENRYWQSEDGLRLHYRDYPAPDADPARPPILCMPGLTRNARDFEPIAEHLAGRWRMIAVDFRGRGESAYAKDPLSYVPLTYVQDVARLLGEIGIRRCVVFGTSLGGLCTMVLAASAPGLIAGALLNDIGPEIEEAGLARIRTYVGKPSVWPTWMHAARCVQEGNADVYPHYGIEEWLAMAKRLYRLNSAGRIVLDYDMKIAEPFKVPGNEAPADLWPVLAALKGTPTLIVRGALSDILSRPNAEKMRDLLDCARLVTVQDTGHTPTLDEPVVLDGVEWLLDQVMREPAAA